MSVLRLIALTLVCCLSFPLAAELFISEYVEGSSNNKAIEIYNPDLSAVDLTAGGYQLLFYFNGSASPGLTLNLTGTVAAGDVYVVAHSSANATILAQADLTNGSGWYNGDDAVALRKGGTTIIDSVGQVGVDPGTQWGSGLTSTADNTLRRKSTICEGDTNATDAFDPATEWDGFATDTFGDLGTHTASCGGATFLSIDDVALAEGDAGTTTFTFTVSLSAPAGPGGVTFDIATADNTATTADNDYVANSLTGQTILEGSTTYAFDVTVNGDTTIEANESFFVNVTNITGATAGDAQGTGTISNDDVTLIPIHDVQGPGATSPIVGATVSVRGIVTGVKSNGFFVQEEDAEVDADPATSEGIFVYTGAAPGVTFASLVQVTGTVTEFAPADNPLQPVTELTSPSILELATAQPLPTAVPLTTTFPDPAGPYDQLERVEGMRVSVASITVSGPTDGSVSEANNTGTSNGRFHGVVTGVARPFREPGIQAPDVPPTGSIPPIPRWDFNPERLRIESATLVGQPVLTVKSGDVVGPIAGPLDYGFRGYAIYPDGTLGTPTVTESTLDTTVTAPAANEFTVASFNLQRFFDTVNDPIGDPVLSPLAYDTRLTKASLAIRNHLHFPDIIGVQEAEKIEVLQDLAARISTDALANAQPDPQYLAYLMEGNDVGGIDVGYLVKTALVEGTERVTVNSVTQIGAADTWIDPTTGAPDPLHDRPSLVLDATVNRGASSYPVIVVNNHLRSLIGIDNNTVSGPTTTGDRVRRKRQLQAEAIATYLQGRLTTNPDEHIVLIGDFNAFEFNDGYADTVNTIMGTPSPDDQTVVCSTCPVAPDTNDGTDLVNPDFVNLVTTPPVAERYSYVHEGNAQNLDHAIASAGIVADTLARRVEHPRVNADYPETLRSDATTALRLSDHDPVVAYFAVAAFAQADLSIAKADSSDPVTAGDNLAYTVTVTNAGPDAAADVAWNDPLPVGLQFDSLTSPAGWTCTTPAVAANGTISCSIASFPVGSAVFTILTATDPTMPHGTILSNTATVTSTTTDPNPANNAVTETTTVNASANLAVTKEAPASVYAGNGLTYTISVTNMGLSAGGAVTLTDPLPANTTFLSIAIPAGWSCVLPAVGANGTISCTNPALGYATSNFTVTVIVDSAATGTISNTATITSPTPDPNLANNSATAITTVESLANVSVTKSGTPNPVIAGTNVTWTMTVANPGPSDAASVTLTDSVPANTTFVSLTAPAGWSCTTPAVGATGAISCSAALFPASSNAVFTLVTAVDPATIDGTVLSNTATVATTTPDATTTNDTATATVTVGSGSADLSVTKSGTPDPVTAGTNLTWTIGVANAGPSDASSIALNDAVPANTTFVSFTAPAGWTCTTPAVGATGAIDCSAALLPAGANAAFTLVVAVDPAAADGTILSNTASVFSATEDPNGANDTATASVTVGAGSADVSITKVAAADPVNEGGDVSWTVTVSNAGPTNATNVVWTDTLPAETTFVSLVSAAGWTCTTPAVDATGEVRCTIATLPAGSAAFTLVASVVPGTLPSTLVSNTAAVSSDTTDPSTGNETATASVTVLSPAVLSATKSVTGTFLAGEPVTYTIVITNSGTSTQADNAGDEFVDVLPTGLTLTSATASSGTATADLGTNTVTWNGSIAAGAQVTITIEATIDPLLPGGTTITNQGVVAFDADGDGVNEANTQTDDPSGTGGSDATSFTVAAALVAGVPTLDEYALAALAALIAAIAMVMLKK